MSGSHAPSPSAGQPAAPFWAEPEDALLTALQSGPDGLTTAEAAVRLPEAKRHGLAAEQQTSELRLLLSQFTGPMVLILVVATIVSLALGDVPDALIILAIILASGLLGFWQERSASRAVTDLMARVSIHADIRRDGRDLTVPLDEVVPGDLVVLNAGDVIPGDARVLESNGLQVDEASLTGEAFPVHKTPAVLPADTPVTARTNALFMGSHVLSGNGTAVVVVTGRQTEFGQVAAELAHRGRTTGFERGITTFGYLLVRSAGVILITMLVVNVLLGRPVFDSLLFSLALAVGLTPEMLPAIVSISLAAGARRMAREQVIVKRLDAIEDFGGMSVLCTDKTGTLTAGTIALAEVADASGEPSAEIARLARLNATLQTGYANPLDDAIAAGAPGETGAARCLDQVPYDFERKRLSVLVAEGGEPLLITKGAFESVLAMCADAERDGGGVPIAAVRDEIEQRFAEMSSRGYRVLGLATRMMPGATACRLEDERDLTFRGFLAFTDPPKEGAAAAVRELAALGISVRMITGDNPLAAAHIGGLVGLDAARVLSGSDLDALSDADLAAAADRTGIFAEIGPLQKQRIVTALQRSGHTVGYLGDGINDAPSLHAADVGISVDTAVDVAKQSAAIVLLENNLAVVGEGVRLGRNTFANTLKYISVTTSANFGNVLSMAVASLYLPFLPMLPRQILLLNFLSDIPATAIASDRVDSEQVVRPQALDIVSIRRFMIWFGGLSSLFDLVTFVVLRQGFDAGPKEFRSGWFVVSLMTELAVMLILRTRRPFFRSRPGRNLLIASVCVGVLAIVVPFTGIADSLGFTAIPGSIALALAAITAGYIAATEIWKQIYLRRYRPDPATP